MWVTIGIGLALAGCRENASPRRDEPTLAETNGTQKSSTADVRQTRDDLNAVLARSESASANSPPQFTDVAATSGLEFTFFSDTVPGRYFLPEIMGGGAAWFDFDRDGWLDLFLVNGDELAAKPQRPKPHSDALYRNRGGQHFEEISNSAFAGTIGYGQGCAVGDFDADGFEDLYVSGFQTSTLLRNLGDGTFEDATTESNTRIQDWGASVVWLDINDDRNLDLYVVTYLDATLKNQQHCRFNGVPGYCGPGHYEAVVDRLFLNLGDGRFREVGEEVGIAIPEGKGLGIAVLDFDLDGQNEIYVANDMTPNFLFQRQSGSGSRSGSAELSAVLPKFRDVAPESGCAVSDMGQNEASMGVACADFDGNGYCDIFLTHFYAQKNTLYRNLGHLQFEDDSRRSRIAATSFDMLGFGTVAFDYDRDGRADLFVANGHVLGPEHKPFEMLPQLLHNDGQARFDDVGNQAGDYFRTPCVGRGAAGVDYDNDGNLDLLVTHVDRSAALLRNETGTHRLPPQGTQVIVEAGSKRIASMSVGGGSYLCSSDPRLLIGLGEWREPVTLEIRWLSGEVVRHENVAIDRYWLAFEGRELLPPPTGVAAP
ncbi:MAG: hypothetical protein FD138_1688 [Planctomycetota bacterium]|nr:MAG: hypothetical protein FD138_1688 [Planctomycetota bacterium]